MFSDIQIGLAVRSARLASGLSAKQLAERSGLTPSALSKIESGKQTMGLGQAAAVAATLGVRVDHLVALAEEVGPLAAEHENLREQLRNDLRMLQQQTIKTAIAVGVGNRKAAESA